MVVINYERLEPRDIDSETKFEYKEYKELQTKRLSSCSSINHLVIKLTKLQDGVLLFTDAGLRL